MPPVVRDVEGRCPARQQPWPDEPGWPHLWGGGRTERFTGPYFSADGRDLGGCSNPTVCSVHGAPGVIVTCRYCGGRKPTDAPLSREGEGG